MTAGSGKSASRMGLVEQPARVAGTADVTEPPAGPAGPPLESNALCTGCTYGRGARCQRQRCERRPAPGRMALLGGHGCRDALLFPLLVHAPERGERLPDDLIHIVVAVGREPSDEGHVAGLVCERLIFLEQLLVLRPRDRVIGIALRRRIFVGDRRPRVLLAGEMLVLADAGEWHILRRIIHHRDRLEPFLV